MSIIILYVLVVALTSFAGALYFSVCALNEELNDMKAQLLQQHHSIVRAYGIIGCLSAINDQMEKGHDHAIN